MKNIEIKEYIRRSGKSQLMIDYINYLKSNYLMSM